MDAPGTRLSMRHLVDEVRAEFFSVDRGFIRTVWLLLTRPGATIAEVWRGEQPTLTKPLRYFLIVFSIYVIAFVASGALDVVVHNFDRELLAQINRALEWKGLPPTTIEVAREANPFGLYLASPLVFELLNFVLCFVAAWIAFGRSSTNFAERFSMTLYLYGTNNLIQVPFVLFIVVGLPRVFFAVLPFVFLAYLTWAAATLRPPPRWRFALRGALWWGLMYLLFAALMFAVAARVAYRIGHEAGTRAKQAQVIETSATGLSPGSAPASRA